MLAITSSRNIGRRTATDLACSILLLAVLATGRAWGQEASAPLIREVDFLGLLRTEESFAREVAGLEIGTPLVNAELDAAVVRLLRTGRFTAVEPNVAPVEGGVRVRFDVVERVFISAVRFEGNARFSDTRLREQVLVKVDEPLDPFAVRQGVEAIAQLYREEGYADVVVSFDRDLLEQSGELVYRIEEGPRTRIREIEFEGATAFPDRILRRQIQTKKAFWVFRTGAFEEDLVEADVAAIQKFYRDRGWLDARVGYRRESLEDRDGLRVVFLVDEGTRYRIENITFTGQTVFSEEELREMVASAEGEFVDRIQIEADAREIARRYGEIGHIYVNVGVVRVFSEEPGLVRLTLEIEEGQPFRVGRVVVRGNTRTKDKVVRRELDMYPPDDLWNLTAAKEAEQALVDSRIFGSARVYPVGNQPGVRDVMMDVTEADRLGDFLFGLGVTSNSGLVGSVVLDLQNFDLFDYPRSWSEFFRFRAFTGAGQRLRLELRPGTELSSFRSDFTEPYLFDRPLRLDVSAYLFERAREAYDENRLGSVISIGRRIERGPLRNWTGELTLRVENIELDNVELFAGRDIRDDEGQDFLTSLRGTLVRDRTDNRFVPTTGDRFRISYEQVGALGGDHAFGEVRSRYSRFFTLASDALERKTVLEIWGEGGYIIGDAPVYERFYAGGVGSIRGFQFRGIGPRQGLDDNNVGADYLILLGSEYTFPLYGETLRGHFFVDSGTAGSGYRASIGAGVRFTINVLGPVPLEFNLAAPLLSDDEDEEQVFSFVVGSLF